jgi:FtsH-binding integral membrane protein
MTTTHATQTTTGISSAAPIGIASAIVASALTTAFAHDWGEVAFMLPVILVAAGLVFGIVVPRALRKESAGGTALGLSIPAALLTLPAFWTGLPLVLGVAGMVVGNSGRNARSGGGKCIAALVLGALAVLGYLSIYAYELSVGETGFLFD